MLKILLRERDQDLPGWDRDIIELRLIASVIECQECLKNKHSGDIFLNKIEGKVVCFSCMMDLTGGVI